MYAVAGRSAATAATANHHSAALWNPSGNEAIHVWRAEFHGVASPRAILARTTSRGTPGSTITPDVDSHFGRRAAPPSAPVLDLAAFSVQPGDAAPDLAVHWIQAQGQVSVMAFDCPIPITIPPNSGLGWRVATATVWAATEHTFIFDSGPSPFGGDAFYCGAAVPATTTRRVNAHLWNPSSDIALHVFLASMTGANTVAGTVERELPLIRTTARGTQTATTTPDADNHVDQRSAPASGAVIDTAWSADPTFAGPELYRGRINDRSNGSGVVWQIPTDDENAIDLDDCIIVPPGTGLAFAYDATLSATPRSVYFGWYE